MYASHQLDDREQSTTGRPAFLNSTCQSPPSFTTCHLASAYLGKLPSMDDDDGVTNRKREVAKCLDQIDNLSETDVRAILRHLATEDAVFSEKQCIYIANTVDEVLSAQWNRGKGFHVALDNEKKLEDHPYPGVSHGWTDLSGNVAITRVSWY